MLPHQLRALELKVWRLYYELQHELLPFLYIIHLHICIINLETHPLDAKKCTNSKSFQSVN